MPTLRVRATTPPGARQPREQSLPVPSRDVRRLQAPAPTTFPGTRRLRPGTRLPVRRHERNRLRHESSSHGTAKRERAHPDPANDFRESGGGEQEAPYNRIVSLTRLGRILQLGFIFYFLEAGAFLLLSPWGRFWVERVAVRSPRVLQPLLLSHSFRGFIAGVGLLHIAFAVRELEAWRRSPTVADEQPSPSATRIGPLEP
jgi:hypothetical protein